MKNFLQIISFAFIAIVLSVVSIKAQAAQRLNADIPFSFSVGGKTYDAGNYKIKLIKYDGTSGIMTLSGRGGKVLGLFTVLSAGESSTNESTFVFYNSGNDRALSRIVTRDMSYEIPQADSKRRATLAENSERSTRVN